MAKCTDCKHFEYDIDGYPVCWAYGVMVANPRKEEEKHACDGPKWGLRFEPKEAEEPVSKI